MEVGLAVGGQILVGYGGFQDGVVVTARVWPQARRRWDECRRRPNEPAPRLLHTALALTALPFWMPPEAHTVRWVIFRVDGVGCGGPRLNMIYGCVCEGVSRRD